MTMTLQENLAIADFDLREMDADAGVLGEEEFRAKWHARVADAVRGHDGPGLLSSGDSVNVEAQVAMLRERTAYIPTPRAVEWARQMVRVNHHNSVFSSPATPVPYAFDHIKKTFTCLVPAALRYQTFARAHELHSLTFARIGWTVLP
jgi:hypothetical protein